MEASKHKPFHPNKRLRAARERRGWSQAALAQLIGTTELTVGRWERGERTPQLIYRAKLSDLFAMSAEDLGLVKPATTEEDTSNPKDALIHSESVISSIPSVKPTASEPLATADTGGKSIQEKKLYLPLSSLWERRKAGQVSHTNRGFPYMKSIRLWACLIILFVAIGAPGSLLLAHAFPSTAGKVSTPTVLAYSGTKSTAISPHIGALVQSHQDADPTCPLLSGRYHMRAIGVGYCLDERVWLSDFEYSVRVAIRQGTQAGIVFRAVGSHFYYFSIDIAGHYYLDVVGPLMAVRTLVSGFNHVVVPEAGQTNLLDVMARGNMLRLYVNGMQVGQVRDGSYTRGYVGICVGNYYDVGGKRVTVGDFWDGKV